MLLLSLKNKTFSCSTSVRWVGEEEKLNEIKKKKKKEECEEWKVLRGLLKPDTLVRWALKSDRRRVGSRLCCFHSSHWTDFDFSPPNFYFSFADNIASLLPAQLRFHISRERRHVAKIFHSDFWHAEALSEKWREEKKVNNIFLRGEEKMFLVRKIRKSSWDVDDHRHRKRRTKGSFARLWHVMVTRLSCLVYLANEELLPQLLYYWSNSLKWEMDSHLVRVQVNWEVSVQFFSFFLLHECASASSLVDDDEIPDV